MFCSKGLKRSAVIKSMKARGGHVEERNFTLAEVYAAEETFVTGTLGGVTPVTKIDGRDLGDGRPGC